MYAGHRVALVGDAAYTVHPLAGQGVNLGFGDAASLSRVLQRGVEMGHDIGQVDILEEYERDRKKTNMAMMAILDGLQKMYATNLGPLNIARSAGFSAVHLLGQDGLCRRMYEVIENDLLGSLQLAMHHIAPYKTGGAERTSEVFAERVSERTKNAKSRSKTSCLCVANGNHVDAELGVNAELGAWSHRFRYGFVSYVLSLGRYICLLFNLFNIQHWFDLQFLSCSCL